MSDFLCVTPTHTPHEKTLLPRFDPGVLRVFPKPNGLVFVSPLVYGMAKQATYTVPVPCDHSLSTKERCLVIAFALENHDPECSYSGVLPPRPGVPPPLNLAIYRVPPSSAVEMTLTFASEEPGVYPNDRRNLTKRILVTADEVPLSPIILDLVPTSGEEDDKEWIVQNRVDATPWGPISRSLLDQKIEQCLVDAYQLDSCHPASRLERFQIAYIPEESYRSPAEILASSQLLSEWYVSYAELVKAKKRDSSSWKDASISHHHTAERIAKLLLEDLERLLEDEERATRAARVARRAVDLAAHKRLLAEREQRQAEHSLKIQEDIQVFVRKYGLSPKIEKLFQEKLLKVLTHDVLSWLVKSFEDPHLKENWYSDSRRHVLINKILAILREARCMERDLATKSTPINTVPAASEGVDGTSPEKKPTLGSLIAELKAGNFSWLKFFGVPVTPRRKPRSGRKLKRIERSALTAKDAEIAHLREQLASLTQTVQTLAAKIETISGDK